MAKSDKKQDKPPFGFKLLGLLFAVPTGIAMRKATDAAWYAARGNSPPKNPAAPDVAWGEALAWAAVSGLAVAGGRLLAARGAAATYRTFTGHLPPGINAGSP